MLQDVPLNNSFEIFIEIFFFLNFFKNKKFFTLILINKIKILKAKIITSIKVFVGKKIEI